MLKHATILVVATVSALASAQGLISFTEARGAPVEPSAPPPVTVDARPSSAAQVRKAADGHYWAEANVNGRWVRFLVDTGASAVALTGADAARLGFDLDALDYARPVITANGEARAAMVTLDHVAVAGARVEKVEALVVRQGLQTSLLGMSYLGRLSRFEASRDALILRP